MGCADAPPTHEQQPAVSPSDVHTSASHHVLEAKKMWDYVNLAQLELRSRDALSCMLPGAGWPQEKCAQGWRSRNKAQAIPRRRSLRAVGQCCSSHRRSQMRAHLAGVGKHLAYPPAPNGSLPFIFLKSWARYMFNSAIKDASFSSKSPVSSRSEGGHGKQTQLIMCW